MPTANPAGIKTPADLAKSGVKVIAAGDEVPITKYATQLVDNLAKEAGYPADFAAEYAANVASKEDNVKAVVAKIELGEGDAGIVYVTDAKASTKVTTVDVPDAANVPATYAGVVVKASKNAGRGQGVPRLVRRTRRPGDPGRLRVPAAVVIEDAAGRRPSRGGARAEPTPAIGRWGERSLAALAALFALFLGLPVLTLVARAILDGSLATAVASPVVLDALWLSLVTTAISLVITVVARAAARVRPRPPRSSAARAGSRRSSTCRSCCRRRSPASRCCWSSVGAACSAAPFEVLGISIPFTTIAVILAQTFVSAPFFIRSARTGIAGVDRDLEDAARVDGASERQLFRVDHGAPGRARPWRPAW